MKNSAFFRKAIVVFVIVGLLLVSISVAAQSAEEPAKKGFVLFGISLLYEGSEKIRGGVVQLLDGNEQLVTGLDDLGTALDEKIAGGLTDIKGGIDNKLVPGLDDILAGITGQVVPGLRDLKTGVDGKIVPGLKTMKTGIDGKLIPGMNDLIAAFEPTGDLTKGISDISGGLGGVIGGLVTNPGTSTTPPSILNGLTGVRFGLKMSGHPAFNPADPLTWGVVEGLAGISGGIGSVLNTIGAPDTATGEAPGATTSIQNDLNVALAVLAAADPTDAMQVQAILSGTKSKLGAIHSQHPAGNLTSFRASLDSMRGKIDGLMVGGLDAMRAGIAALNADGTPRVTYAADGVTPNTLYAALAVMKGGIDTKLLPGINTKVLPGMKDVRDVGLKPISAGLGDVIKGLSGDVSGGLTKLSTGFTKTEATHGSSGVVEGLTLIRGGVKSGVAAEPGVSEGLGLVIGGIRGDVLDGIAKLKGGITEKVMPGLTEMNEGIKGDLQPGFTKVSLLLTGIWLVSLVIFLVVGILIGRGRKGKVSAGRSAAM